MKIVLVLFFDIFFILNRMYKAFDPTRLSYYGAYLSNCPLTDPPLPLPADFSTFSQIWTRADFLHPPARWFCSRGGSGGRQEGHLPPPRKHTPEPKNTPTPTQAATKKNCHTNHTTPTTSSHIRHQIRPALKREYFQVTSRLSATKMSFLTATHLRPILY